MKFSVEPVGDAERHIATLLISMLRANDAVTWFVSGGSAIASQVVIMQSLLAADTDGTLQRRLTILPVDERYGTYGHTDSNSAQMRGAGFDPGGAAWHDVLAQDAPLEDTVEQYGRLVADAMDTAMLATLGMGADAHTAGILPGSPAVTDTNDLVIAYEWADYSRMTTTFRVLQKMQFAAVLAYGDAKEQAIKRLSTATESLAEVPAMVLYDIPSVTVYNSFLEREG